MESTVNNSWVNLKVGDIIKKNGVTAMVTVIDENKSSDCKAHVCIMHWLTDEEVARWEKVNKS